MNLLAAAAGFTEMGLAFEKGVHDALEKACVIVETEAKRVIGTYDYGWPPLQPETVARKANGDTPLLETGEMRDSIDHTVEGKSGYVGSNDDKALWHELGTSRGIPPRPFLIGAAQHKGQEVADAVGKVLFERMIGKP